MPSDAPSLDSFEQAAAPQSVRSIALILAAGAATRMGQLKQLLPLGAETLLSNVIRQSREAGFDRQVVVAGAEGPRVAEAARQHGAEVVVNAQWQQGMGSSIREGIAYIAGSYPETVSAAIILADQPLVTASHLRAMRELRDQLDVPVVAAEYEGEFGAPAVFHRSLFASLRALLPEVGARHLLRSAAVPVRGFPLPEAAVDLDTPADLVALGLRP
jgi:molybdenum cofactor cytidylyltransferase